MTRSERQSGCEYTFTCIHVHTYSSIDPSLWICIIIHVVLSNSFNPTTCRATKLLNLRVFDDPATGKPWDKSVTDVGLEILCVSQVYTPGPSSNSSPVSFPYSEFGMKVHLYCKVCFPFSRVCSLRSATY